MKLDRHLEQISKAVRAVDCAMDELKFQVSYAEDKYEPCREIPGVLVTRNDLEALDAAIHDLPEAGNTWYRMNQMLFDQLRSLRIRVAQSLKETSALGSST